MEITLALIKPDAMGRGLFIDIFTLMQKEFLIGDLVVTRWNKSLAQEFYYEHRQRDFFEQLVEFTASGPIAAVTLVGKNAVQRWRGMIGPTDPAEARRTHPGSVRATYGGHDLVMHNAVHGSDSVKSAQNELSILRMGFAEYPNLAFGRTADWVMRGMSPGISPPRT